MRRALVLFVLAVVLAPACKEKDNTKVVVAVWSDLAVPTELDSIRIDVAGPTQTGTKTLPLTAGKLPVQLTLVPEGAKDATFTVRAVGLRSLGEVVSQTARASFVSGKALLLKLFLGRDCIGKTCSGDYTCLQGLCDQPIGVTSLPPYNPSNLQPPDAGVRSDGSVVLDSGPTLDGRGNEPVAPDMRVVDSHVFEAAAEAASDVPISPAGTGGAGGAGGRTGTISSGGTAGSTGLGGAPGTGGAPAVDARTIDAVGPDDVPLGGAGGAIPNGGTGGAPGTGGAGGTGGTGGEGGATGGATGTGGVMEACVFGTSRFGNCKFGP